MTSNKPIKEGMIVIMTTGGIAKIKSLVNGYFVAEDIFGGIEYSGKSYPTSWVKEIVGYHKDFCISKSEIMKMIGEIDTMEEEYNTKVKELNNEKTNCKACETYISKPNFYDGIPCKEHIDKKDKLEAEYTTPYGIHRIVLNSIIKKILEKLIQQDGIERSDIGDKQ